MAKQKDFDMFLKNIEPSESTIQYISSIHTNLRDYLCSHNLYKEIHKDTFLSGSYAKHTSIRPVKEDKKRDVDIIVVTNYSCSDKSDVVLNELCAVLKEKSIYSSAKVQHHSVGVEMGQISVDVVPVIIDKEDDSIFYIGDLEKGTWELTDPKGHKIWSTSVNNDNNEKFKPLVKIFKWWRRTNCPIDVRYPKGITFEKLIADNIGDSTSSMEDLLIETMENIVSTYGDFVERKYVLPIIDDPSDKIMGNNLLAGYNVEDFKAFINNLYGHLQLLNDEGTENDTWRKILGKEFPKSTIIKQENNMIVCRNAVHRKKMPWPFSRGGVAFIRLEVKDSFGNIIQYENNGIPLHKGYSLKFRAYTGVKTPFTIKWQITNTGEEARSAGDLRGKFEDSDDLLYEKIEHTKYTGSHSIQCFVIKNGVCVARSQELIINVI